MKQRWQKMTDDIIGKKGYFFIDPPIHCFFIVIKQYIEKYVKGNTLDAGAGRLAMKFLLEPKASAYYSIDNHIARKELNIVGDLNNLPFKSGAFDTVLIKRYPKKGIGIHCHCHRLGDYLKFVS